MTKTFPSKVSYGLLLVLFLLFFGPIVFTWHESPDNLALTFMVVHFISFVYVVYTIVKTNYKIDGDLLKVNNVFFTYPSIHISSIKKISKTNSIMASPAPSLNRIKIYYGINNSIILSPKDKSSFFEALKKINPDIEFGRSLNFV